MQGMKEEVIRIRVTGTYNNWSTETTAKKYSYFIGHFRFQMSYFRVFLSCWASENSPTVFFRFIFNSAVPYLTFTSHHTVTVGSCPVESSSRTAGHSELPSTNQWECGVRPVPPFNICLNHLESVSCLPSAISNCLFALFFCFSTFSPSSHFIRRSRFYLFPRLILLPLAPFLLVASRFPLYLSLPITFSSLPPTLLVSEAFLFNWLCFSVGLSASPLPGFLLRSLSLFASQMPPSETVLPPRVSKCWPSTRKATKKAASCFLDTESKRVIQALKQPKNRIFNQSYCSSKKSLLIYALHGVKLDIVA